ncbi:MAG: hypothetical protein JWN02_2746 [Acidobacteria bacterium]|nr:hypothetical protein [Acidobacteriota bacterium]
MATSGLAHRNSALRSVLLNLGLVIGSWLLAIVLVNIASRLWGGASIVSAASLTAAIAGLAASLRFQARASALILVFATAVLAAELIVHLSYGVHAAQGAAAHLGIMLAGLFGTVLVAVLMRNLHSQTSADAS